MIHQREGSATRTAPMGNGSSWQPESDTVANWNVMRHRNARVGGWSRFDTKTAARGFMIAFLNEILPPQRKGQAAFQAFGR